MKTLCLALLFAAAAFAQTSPLTFYIVGSNGATPTPLPSTSTFADTPVGTATDLTVQVTNTSAGPVQLINVFVGDAAGSVRANADFSITGLDYSGVLAPQMSKTFVLHFTPQTLGGLPGYLQATYSVNQNNATISVSTLQGNGTAPQLQLTCRDSIARQCDGATVLQPGSSTPINFGPIIGPGPSGPVSSGGVPVGSTYQITFTFTNSSPLAVITPAISLISALYSASVFSVDTSALSAQIAANSTASFTVTFAPQPNFSGPSGNVTEILKVGNNAYSISGIEIGSLGTGVNNDPLQVKCAYQKTSQPCQMSGSTVQFGPDLNTLTATFSLANPNLVGSVDTDITLPQPPSISGAAFTSSMPTLALTTAASAGSPVQSGQPVTIPPGYTLTFQVTFGASSAANATLNIANGISFTLSGQTYPAIGGPQSDLPGITIMCGTSPCSSQTFTSQQTVQATLQVSTPTTASVTLAMQFQPLAGLTDDSGITFTLPVNAREIGPINFAAGSTTGSFAGGQSQFTFQTATTAGTIVITATDSLTQQTLTWPIDILPSKVQIISVKAVRQSPNLVVTIDGYDNTYSVGSAGPLSFSFATTAGTLTTTADASSAFHQYFFTNNTAGGAFSLQASFAVSNGDVTQITSVVANLTNSAGQTSLNQAFQ